MQRIKHVDQKLLVWAEWRIGASGGYRSPAYHECNVRYTDDPVNSYVEYSLEIEAAALKIDRAVASLPTELRKTVIAFYTWEGGVDIISRRLGVTRATVHRRLCNADIRIDDWLNRLQERSEQISVRDHKNNFATYTD